MVRGMANGCSDRSRQRNWPKRTIDAHKAREAQDRDEVRENAISLLHLSHQERLDVLEAREVLKGIASLRDAAEFFVRHHSAEAGSCTLDELIGRATQSLS